MTDEPDDEISEPDNKEDYPVTKMSEETRETIFLARQMIAGAEEEAPPAYTLFSGPVLEMCGGLFASDDYYSDDGWPAIKALQKNVYKIFEVRAAAFNAVDWRTMAQVWGALCKEAADHRRARGA